MAHIEPLARESLPQYEPIFQMVEASMGFVPSSMRTMARIPKLFEAFGQLAGTVMNAGEIDRTLVQMVAHVASTASGCRYCEAHTATHASHLGVDDAKIEAVWEFEASALFTDAERAALRLARDAAQVPNLTTEQHFADLAEHFTDEQVVQIVATIGLFGYLNRWNDTMATTLEDEPRELAQRLLGERGWSVGKHDDGRLST